MCSLHLDAKIASMILALRLISIVR